MSRSKAHSIFALSGMTIVPIIGMSCGRRMLKPLTICGPIFTFKHTVDSVGWFHLLSKQGNIRICSNSRI